MYLAWKSTLYVTNFSEGTDDAVIRELFGSVRLIYASSTTLANNQAVRENLRCSLAEQAV